MQGFRQRRRADQEEPVPVGAGEGFVGLCVHRQGGGDVEQHHALHGVRMIEGEAMGHARATVVGEDRELLEAQRLHQSTPSRAISRLE